MRIQLMMMNRSSGAIEKVEATITCISVKSNEYILAQNEDGSTVAVSDGEEFDVKMISSLNGAVLERVETKTIIDLIGSRPKNINISF